MKLENITIRTVDTEDSDAISQLSQQLGYSISAEHISQQINEILNSADNIACVAALENKVVGWIHVFYTVRLESASFCEIGGLIVDEHYRNMGIGKLLIEYIKPWCTDKKCKILKVRSNIKRANAHKFYLHAGFEEIKQQKVFQLSL